MASSGRSSRSSSASDPRRTGSAGASRSRSSGATARRSSPRSTTAGRMRVQREQAALHKKKQLSSKAAGKGAILILAIALLAIKAFSSLPSTQKTSDKTSVNSSPKSTTSTTFANSVSNGGQSSRSSSSSTPDQVVLPQTVAPSANSSSGASPSTTASSSGSVSNQALSSSANSLITVRVFNGTTVAGAAGKMTNQLAQDGYDVVAPTNASIQDASVTSIYYSPGYLKQADQLAVVIGLGTSSVKPLSFSTPIPPVQPSDLNIVLGTDKAN